MIVLERSEIESCLDWQVAGDAIKAGFIAYVNGQTNVADHAYMRFQEPPGDCHVRSGFIAGTDAYVVKVASGFYENPALGLPSSDGLMVLFSAQTGRPLVLLADRGLLTDVRTALCGAMATQLLARDDASTMGVVGTGTQARLQIEAALFFMPHLRMTVWGRDAAKARKLQSDLSGKIEVACSLQEMCSTSDIIVTTTCSREPLVRRTWVKPGTHITAVGSDAPGKQELEVALLTEADRIVADTIENSLKNGELAHAVAANILDLAKVEELGDALKRGRSVRRPEAITIADLTGSAIEDVAIANVVWRRYIGKQEASHEN